MALLYSLDYGSFLEKDVAIHSSIVAWRILWRKEPGGFSPWGYRESDMTEATLHAHVSFFFFLNSEIKKCKAFKLFFFFKVAWYILVALLFNIYFNQPAKLK